jgi:tetratricopeptide (TPR) repeat protein
VARSLEGLAARDLIRPAAASFVDEAAFRFKHSLVRDAAYNGIAKKLRAELHEGYASWLEGVAGDRLVEHEEILGYHLEAAYRYRAELGPVEGYRSLAERAAQLLGNAGVRAAGRGDAAAAGSLLARTLALLPEDAKTRPELLLTLGEVRWSSLDPEGASTALNAAVESAAASGRRELEGSARLTLASIGVHMNEGRAEETFRLTAEEWLPVLQELGDERGLAKAWFGLGLFELVSLRFRAAADLLQRALEYARRSGSGKDELDCTFWLSNALLHGPEPVGEALRRLESLADGASTRAARATLRETVGSLAALDGRFEEARRLVEEAAAAYEDLGLEYQLGYLRAWTDGLLAELASDTVEAERAYRWGHELLEGVGERSALSTVQAQLASVLCDQGRYDEAEELTRSSEAIGDPDDLITQAGWRVARARVLARRSKLSEAEVIAREALAMAGDYVFARGRSYEALAEVLALAGRSRDANEAVREAVAVYEEKGNAPFAQRARGLLDRLAASGVT